MAMRNTYSQTVRLYPLCCTSAYCGRGDCKGCKNLPTLEEFQKWVKDTGATRTDPIWCPRVYTVEG